MANYRVGQRVRNYLSVCSGIEAATVAWHPLGWTPAAYSEIEKFPSELLAHHYPAVPNWGDMTRYQEWPDANVDVLVGGTPCQAFSVAGLRKGLADPRGNLTLTFLAIAARYRPEWVVWENVPGVFSDDGNAFGCFLAGLAELGYMGGYRVLDAQYWGVAQRRRRPFVVGHARDWRRAAAVLFERESLSGNPPPSRETGERTAACLTRGAESSGRGGYAGRRQEDDINIVPAVANPIGAHGGPCGRMDLDNDTYVAHALRAEGFDASEDGTGRGIPLVSMCLNAGAMGRVDSETETMIPVHSVCLGSDPIHARELAMPQTRRNGDPGTIQAGMRVRRLTPRECERLQGFPDDYTLIPRKGGKLAADGPRYKALGNSMAVPVMRWIGQRISDVHRQGDAP